MTTEQQTEPAAIVAPNPFLAVPADDLIAARKNARDMLDALTAEFEKHVAPIRADLALIDEAVLVHAESTGATVIPHSDYARVEIVQSTDTVWNEVRLFQELRNLRINGVPIPEEELKKASWQVPPKPPEPKYSKHVTRLEALAKRYGEPVRKIIESCCEKRRGPKRVKYVPLERPADVVAIAAPAESAGDA